MPGPGMYDSPSRLGKGGPSYTMKSARKEFSKDDNPGPGAYELNNSINRDKSPSYRMGTGQRTTVVNK